MLNLYVVRHPDRDRILEELRNRKIHCNVSYPFPIHTMRGYQRFNYKEGDLPTTEAAAGEIFSLPLFPTLGDDEQETVCRALEEILS